ncbi:hypothetical protein NDU88_006476, partial [Pleurodeles waltl]
RGHGAPERWRGARRWLRTPRPCTEHQGQEEATEPRGGRRQVQEIYFAANEG